MRKTALQVEHKFRNRVVGVHMIDGRKALTTIGSAPTTDIRVLGDEVAGIHAAFEREGDTWILADLGSQWGTWVNKQPVIECKIEGAVVIHIGGHQLKATPHVLDRDLFAKPLSQGDGAFVYHQVVVLKQGLVHTSLLLEPDQAYLPEVPGFTALDAPKDFEWTVTESGHFTIKQRLTKTDRAVETTVRDAFGDDWKRPTPVIAAILMLFLVFGMMFLLPQTPDDQMKTLTPELQNQYTRMIFDGQKVRAKKLIAEKLRKNLSGQSKTGVAKNTGGDAGAKVADSQKTPTGAKVMVNLKNANLGALIGKIAARASKNAQLIQAAGATADRHTGRALGIGGGSSLDKLGGGSAGAAGQALKVGGLGTSGKGGGSNSYKGTGALSLGNIGNAEVGAIEEESEVEGGLDKEAIARVIRAQLGQIRYCYERQLSANPDLYGKLLVKFTIGAAGSVVAQTIGTTSLNNAMVEGCILRRIAGWQFPTPKGGTNVLVTYPFLFKSTR